MKAPWPEMTSGEAKGQRESLGHEEEEVGGGVMG